jgi:hypothetical protein
MVSCNVLHQKVLPQIENKIYVIEVITKMYRAVGLLL